MDYMQPKVEALFGSDMEMKPQWLLWVLFPINYVTAEVMVAPVYSELTIES